MYIPLWLPCLVLTPGIHQPMFNKELTDVNQDLYSKYEHEKQLIIGIYNFTIMLFSIIIKCITLSSFSMLKSLAF